MAFRMILNASLWTLWKTVKNTKMAENSEKHVKKGALINSVLKGPKTGHQKASKTGKMALLALFSPFGDRFYTF